MSGRPLPMPDPVPFDPLAPDDGETEPGYDEWFRATVEAAMNSTEPTVAHEEVMAEIDALIESRTNRGSDSVDRRR
jgi:hypothetical protein